MRRPVLLFLTILVIAIGGYALFGSRTKLISTPTPSVKPSINVATPNLDPEIVNYQAGFAIFTNGTYRTFADPKYHNQSADVFIEADTPNIIHVRKDNVTWNDFFGTLPMKLTKECLTTGTGQIFCSTGQERLKFYLKGEEDPDALDRPIGNGDKLLVSYGDETEQEISLQMQQIPTVK